MTFTPSIIINLCDIYDGNLSSSLREEVRLNSNQSSHIAQVDAITFKGIGYWYDHQHVELNSNENKTNVNDSVDFVSTLTKKIANIRALVNADTDVNINVYVITPLYQVEPEELYDFLINALEEVCQTNLVQQFNVFTVGLTSGFSQVVTHEIDTLKAIARKNLEKLNTRHSLCFPHKLILLDTIGVTGASVGFYCHSLSKAIAELIKLHSTAEYLVTGAFSHSFINSVGIGIIECDKHLLESYLSSKITEDFISKNCTSLSKRNRTKLHQISNKYLEDQIQLLTQNKIIDKDLDDLKRLLGDSTHSLSEKAYILETILSEKETEELRLLDCYDVIIKKVKHHVHEDNYTTFEHLRSLKFDLIDAENEYNESVTSNDPELVSRLKEEFNIAKEIYQTNSKIYYKLLKTLNNQQTRKKVLGNSLSNISGSLNSALGQKSKKCWLLRIFKRSQDSNSFQPNNAPLNNENVASFVKSVGEQIEHLKVFKENTQYYYDQLKQLESKFEQWKDSTVNVMKDLSFDRPLFIKLLFTKETLDTFFLDRYLSLSIKETNVYDTLIKAISKEEEHTGKLPYEITLRDVKDSVNNEIKSNLSFINDFNIYHYFENSSQYKYLIQNLDVPSVITTVYNAANPFIHCTEVYKNYDRFGNPASVQSKFSNMLFSPNYRNDEDVKDFKSVVKKTIASNSPNHSTYLQEKYKVSFLRIPYDLEMEHLVEWYASPEDMPTTFEEYEELHKSTIAKQQGENDLNDDNEILNHLDSYDNVNEVDEDEVETEELTDQEFSDSNSALNSPITPTP